MTAPEPDIFRCQIVQTFMVSPCVVVGDELLDPSCQLFGEVIIIKQNGIFHCPVLTLNLTLGHRMIGLATGMGHIMLGEPIAKFLRDVTRAIVAEEFWSLLLV